MAKEWILNNTMNRFQLNFKRNVGATYENIRKCAPKTLKECEDYYFTNLKTKSQNKFKNNLGGNVYYIYSLKEGKKKIIANSEVIEEIEKEMQRLDN